MMKKIIFIILIILVVIVVLVNKVNKRNNTIISYDLVIGMVENGYGMGDKNILYGYRNDEIIKIDGNYKADFSNFYKVCGTNELITYFDYNTWAKLYVDMGRVETGGINNGTFGIGEKQEIIFKKYYENYVYNTKDKKAFDNMINYIRNTKPTGYNIEYFFITENNYYIYMYEHPKYCMYQYDYTNNTLNKLFALDGQINYFKQNNLK